MRVPDLSNDLLGQSMHFYRLLGIYQYASSCSLAILVQCDVQNESELYRFGFSSFQYCKCYVLATK